MSEPGKEIVGCSGFGLADAVVSPGDQVKTRDHVLESAVLPGKPYGRILVGDTARKERIHSGLPWPPEAQIRAGGHIRRAPIACVWRALVEAGDRQARWEVGEGVSFPLARILAAHLNDLLGPQEKPFSATIAIPDDLDEYGQQALLDELSRGGLPDKSEIRLLWRPVAGGLAWLKEAGGDMKRKTVEKNPDNFFLVLYLGPDAVECVPFRLRVRRHKKNDNIENDYILLRRERPKRISYLAGYDWPARILEEMFQQQGKGSDGAFWQALVLFPDLWEMLAGRPPVQEDLPRVWGQENGYDFWVPDCNDFEERIKRAVCGPSKQLRELLKSSCVIQGTTPHDRTWPESLTALVRKTVSGQENGRMVGMVVCGPLAPSEPPSWLCACFPELEARGLDTSGPWDTREANRLWMSPGNDALAGGAALFQQRLHNGEPTYLDTLPQYFLLTKKDGGYTASPLVSVEDVDGGEEYKNLIEGFAIEKDRQRLDVVVARGSRHEELLKSGGGVDRLDQEVGKAVPGLSMAGASLVRHLVRTAQIQEKEGEDKAKKQKRLREKSLKRVQQNLRNIGDDRSAAIRYSEVYTDLWHGQPDGTEKKQLLLWQEEAKSSMGEVKPVTPFRKLTFPFPVPSPKEMPVELQVRIRPASGMAQMEVIPQDATFLHGRKVFVDYRTMRPCPPEDLVSDVRGWPPLEELAPHPAPAIWDKDNLVASFERAIPLTESFKKHLNDMYDLLKTPKFYEFPIGGDRIYLPVLTQNGLAGCPKGEKLISRFSEILQNHTTSLRSWDNIQAGWLITRATWLYGATPDHVNTRIREEIAGRNASTRTVEAGSRSLMDTPGLAALFGCIAKKIQNDSKFVIQNIRASRNILTLRKNGQDALNKNTSNILLKAVLKVLEDYASKNNYKNKLFVSIKLLLYFLRYRKCDERFVPADSKEAVDIKEKLTGYLAGMKRNMSQDRFKDAEEIINGTIGYLNYVGKTDFLDILTKRSGTDDGVDDAGDDI